MGFSCYRAHGLCLRSAIPLPELPTAQPPADVTVDFGTVADPPTELDEDGAGFWIRDDRACHFRREAGAFLVRAGEEILVDPVPGAAEEVIRLGILGPALGLILLQRGVFPLHGSAVGLPGGAAVFLGASGSGKSTLAGLLHARGHAFLSDDVTALETPASGIRVIPSFPQMKLWPDAAEALLGGTDGLPLLHPDFDKRAHRPAAGFDPRPRPLRRLYLLRVDRTVEIAPVEATIGLRVVMASWYGSRFGPALLRNLDPGAHLRDCTTLLNEVPLRLLRRPPSLNDDRTASEVEEAILRDLEDERPV